MQNDEYTHDFPAWAERQADLIRSIAGVPGLDVEHVAEEIEDLGRSDVLRVQGHLRQAMSRLIKIVSDPHSTAVPHWEQEVMTFVLDASDAYAPAYRQRIDMDKVWRKARKEAAVRLRQSGISPVSLPDDCPLDLDWMVGDDFEIDFALGSVRSSVEPSPRD